ncbi:hypothetical protein MNBD_GAMMA05-395 [hydrothermal vent metagenome]|uniref:Uncharacterized protein n=1 Tax=hydrothermal vent metagenome TaxID=652676 RepID=A0A3B0WC71_9ZZZZ
MLQGDDKIILTNIAKVVGLLVVIMITLIIVASHIGADL